jgi:hypothetical protein
MQSSRLFFITLGALTLDLSARSSELPPSNPAPGAAAPVVER